MTTTPDPAPDDHDLAQDAHDAPHRLDELDAAGLAERLRAPGELTPGELAALYRLSGGWPDPDDDDPGYEDPSYDDCGSGPTDPSGDDGELADLGEPVVPEALEAGFTHRYGGHGTGFAAGSPLDVMLPGSDLAWHVGQARQRGLDALSDDELVGVLCAAGRLASWQAELELAVTAELDARRSGQDGREGEHVAEEVAAALTLTGRSAGSLLELSRCLQRLPQTTALLASGVIDRARAGIIADQLALLPGDAAAAVEDRIVRRAGEMTTGQLRAACQRAVLAYDPQAAARRREKAEKDARVECWAESAGTGAIAGRDLNLAAVIAADQHLDAAARWLQRRGAPGTMDQLRAGVFLARLAGQTLESLLPAPGAAGPGGPGHAPDTGRPASPGSGPDPAMPGDLSPGHGAAGPGSSPNPAGSPDLAGSPSPNPDPRLSGPAWPAGLGGSVNLTMPAATWLGLSDNPGEIAGTGAADADTCRDLAAALATQPDSHPPSHPASHPAARWCLTLTDPHGRAVAHGCARAGPGPPNTADPAAELRQITWLRQITITPVETGTCAHRRQSAGYQPAPSLRHLIKIRSPRCGYPGCRRPATRCDDDHTIPHHQGGRTCECNLYPLCRRHHQAKQAPGWHLTQPQPGQLTWTLPSGRRYTIAPEPYPA